MADSNAVRSRRKRLHAAGDHSECTSRCDAARMRVAPSVARCIDLTHAEDLDGVTELRRLAARLVAASEADPGNTAIAKELRETLTRLPVVEDYVPDEIDMLNMRRSVRRDPALGDLFRTFRMEDGR